MIEVCEKFPLEEDIRRSECGIVDKGPKLSALADTLRRNRGGIGFSGMSSR